MTSTLVQATVWTHGPPNPPPSVVWSKQWGQKPLLFTAGEDVNLDQVPPNVNAAGVLQLNSNMYNDSNFMASWTGNRQGAATAAGCAELISTEGVNDVKPVTGDIYCAKSDQGNIAIFVVQQINTDSSDNMTSTLVQATVWTTSN